MPLSVGDTTYLCAIDGNGMMVSMIISIQACSAACRRDTGVLLNNRPVTASLWTMDIPINMHQEENGSR